MHKRVIQAKQDRAKDAKSNVCKARTCEQMRKVAQAKPDRAKDAKKANIDRKVLVE